ncbi:hypothetical protein [Helicobacter sp. T3_23-1056]
MRIKSSKQNKPKSQAKQESINVGINQCGNLANMKIYQKRESNIDLNIDFANLDFVILDFSYRK